MTINEENYVRNKVINNEYDVSTAKGNVFITFSPLLSIESSCY